MEYFPTLCGGLLIAFIAAVVRFAFELLDREHKRTVAKLQRTEPGHHRWLYARRERRSREIRSRELVRR
jgi:hypothetical protein